MHVCMCVWGGGGGGVRTSLSQLPSTSSPVTGSVCPTSPRGKRANQRCAHTSMRWSAGGRHHTTKSNHQRRRSGGGGGGREPARSCATRSLPHTGTTYLYRPTCHNKVHLAAGCGGVLESPHMDRLRSGAKHKHTQHIAVLSSNFGTDAATGPTHFRHALALALRVNSCGAV